MDPSSYVSGAARAERSTLALDAATSKVGPHAATSMEQAAAGAGKAEGALGKLNKSAGTLGFTLGGLAGVGAAVAAGLSVKWAGDYQSALTRLVTTAGESQKNIAAVGQGMLDMAGQVGIGAQELAHGMYTVESSGIHGAAALGVLKAGAQGAKQENADLSKVLDAVTTALHDYNLPASDAARVTSQLITAVSHGKTSFDELTGAMHSVTPLAAALGVPLADIAGTLSAMTASGESADQAAQNMADALRHMQNPTATMTAELAQLGINSAELGPMLGKKGLAGTIQTIAQAIVQHLDPATKQVLLPALNKSKTAAQDLQIMLGSMPPTLAKMSKGLLDGSVSISDYQKAAKGLSGQQGAMGLQFLSLVKSSQGFSNILKAGGPAAQTYTAALQKAMGTSAGLTVALQVTGEHAAATNAAIKDIGKAAGDTAGNIKGWDEVQSNFNQRLAQVEAGAKSLAIEAGQRLLPALTGVLGYVEDHGPAAMHDLGAAFHAAEVAAKPLIDAGGGILHVFQELPAPIKDVVVGLVALKAASSMGWLEGLATGGGKVKAAFAGMREEMALQQSLFAMNARSAAGAGTQVRTLAQEMESLSASATRSGGSLGTFGSVKAAAAVKGMSALKSAGSGVVGLFGGPWGIALTGAALTVGEFASALGAGQQRIDGYATSLFGLYKQQDLGGQSAVDASKKLDDYQKKIDDAQKALNDATAATHSYGEASYGSALGTTFAGQSLDELRAGLAKAKDQMSSYHASLSLMDTAQIGVTRAENALALVMKQNPGNSTAVADAAAKVRAARANLTTVTDTLTGAEKSHLQVMQQEANAALAAANSQLAAQQAQIQLSQAIAQYNQDAHDGQHSTAELRQEQLSLAQSAIAAAQAAGQAAADQATANGATDTATIAQKAQLDSLRKVADQMVGPGRDAILAQIKILEHATTATNLTQEAMTNLGLTVDGLPDGHLITIDAPTAKQEKALHDLGYMTIHLPNGKVIVSADTHPALKEIQDLIQTARTQSILIRASVSTPNYGPTQRPGAAIGGLIHPFADGGWYTPMSGRVADIVAPQTYRLIGDRVVGDEAFIPINGSPRSQQILAKTAGRMGYGLTAGQAAPVRTRELVGAGGGGGAAAIDYRQLAAAVAAAIPDRPTVSVGTWKSESGQTPYENAEALAFISRTRS
jgi:TP901 family phage tail tape measure protein